MTTKRTKRYGILGGSFNPIHNGHVELAKTAMAQLGLDGVLVMPNSMPDYKEVYSNISTEHRVSMIKLAIGGCPGLEYSDLEIRRGGITYTADTLTELSRLYPEIHWYFIMGGDSIMYFDRWKRPEVILRLATILAACRDDASESAIEEKAEQLRAVYPFADIRLLRFDRHDVSSSDIRRLAGGGRSIQGMVCESVERYIEANGIYR